MKTTVLIMALVGLVASVCLSQQRPVPPQQPPGPSTLPQLPGTPAPQSPGTPPPLQPGMPPPQLPGTTPPLQPDLPPHPTARDNTTAWHDPAVDASNITATAHARQDELAGDQQLARYKFAIHDQLAGNQ